MDIMHYQSQTLVDVAYAAIKKDITERVLLPGRKIVVRELHERYGISETPIKQALNRLITEGLVESIPRKGIKVREVNWEDLEEIFDIRIMMETYCLKRIIQSFHKNPDIKARMLSNIHEHERVVRHATDLNDHFQNYYLDQEFHQMFISCSGNHRIIRFYNQLRTHDYAHYIYRCQTLEETLAGIREHETIYAALALCDETGLRECVERHIHNAREKVHLNLQKA